MRPNIPSREEQAFPSNPPKRELLMSKVRSSDWVCMYVCGQYTLVQTYTLTYTSIIERKNISSFSQLFVTLALTKKTHKCEPHKKGSLSLKSLSIIHLRSVNSSILYAVALEQNILKYVYHRIYPNGYSEVLFSLQ